VHDRHPPARLDPLCQRRAANRFAQRRLDSAALVRQPREAPALKNYRIVGNLDLELCLSIRQLYLHFTSRRAATVQSAARF